MLPLWNKTLYIFFGPKQIRLLHRGIEQEHNIAPNEDALVKLDTLLDQPQWKNHHIHLVLSNSLVNYALEVFDRQLKDYDAQIAFARHHLSLLFGAVATQWVLRIYRGKTGQPALIAAVEASLLEQLNKIFNARKLKLASITPLLSYVYNPNYHSLKNVSSWLLIHEPEYSLFILLQHGQLTVISAIHHQQLSDLPMLLDRENITSPLHDACKSVHLYAPAQTSLNHLSMSGYEPHVLESKHAKLNGVIQLDFQHEIHQSQWAGWLLFVAGLGLMCEMLFSYQSLQLQRAAIPDDLAAPQARKKTPISQTKEQQQLVEQTQDIVRRLQTPWDDFFAGLESIKNEQAVILSLQHNMQNNVLKIEGEAKDYASLLSLIAELNSTPPFADAVLLHHQIKTDDPQHPVQYSLSMRWKKTP